MSLEKIISEVFADQHKYAAVVVREFELEEIIVRFARAISNGLVNKSPKEPEAFRQKAGNIATLFLTEVNHTLKPKPDSTEKQEVKRIVGSIAETQIMLVVEHAQDRVKTLLAIQQSLQTACELNQFDEADLRKYLSLDRLLWKAVEGDNTQKPIIEKSTTSYYQWLGRPQDLNDLADNLRSIGVLKRVKDFKTWLTKPEEIHVLEFNKNHLWLMMVLINELYRGKKKLLKVYGKNGHFKPFELVARDFHGELLIQEPVKHINQRMKRNVHEHQRLQAIVDNWIKNYQPKKL